jgi:hypothetical protein
MSDNPLAPTRRPGPAEPEPHPMVRHAALYQHVNNQTQKTLQDHVAQMDYSLPILGALAADPDVTAKDVIKALANSVADGKRSPSSAVAAIANMPSEPDKLRPWLKEQYATNLQTTVHAKAALMGGPSYPPHLAQPQPGAAPQGAGPQPAPQGMPMPQQGVPGP